MAIRLADTARPNNYIDAEHLGTFPVAYAEDVWFEDGTRLSDKTFDGQSIQVDELPLASEDELGKIYQYVGETGTYTKGYFYECVSDDNTIPTYYWKEAVGGSGYQFSEDFVNENNNVSLVPEQRIFTGTQAEWDALSTTVKKTYRQANITDDESSTPEYYSTEETKTNKVWIDGKPIYRKVILNPTINTTLLTGVDEVVDYRVKRQCYSGVSQGYVYFDGDPSDGVNTGIYINLANNEVKFNDVHSGTYFNARWVILEYTKTTD